MTMLPRQGSLRLLPETARKEAFIGSDFAIDDELFSLRGIERERVK